MQQPRPTAGADPPEVAARPPEPARPADYRASSSFTTLAELAPQLHSVVQGKVQFARYEFDDCWGPRTVLQVTEVEAVVGEAPAPSFELYVFGGPLPDGSYVSVSELPRYVSDSLYVLFLRNTDWRYSPVIGEHAYRVERLADKEILVDTEGRAIVGVSDAGIEVSGSRITEPVGERLYGIRGDTRAGLPGLNLTKDGDCTSDTDKCEDEKPADESAQGLEISAGRFAKPRVLTDATREVTAIALRHQDFKQQVQRRLDSSRAQVGGRFQFRPRVGCWSSTPTMPEIGKYAKPLVH